MRCLSPVLIPDPLHPISGRIKVPCGKCYACVQNKRSEWTYRLLQEDKHSSSSFFITLTYADPFLHFDDDGMPILIKEHIQLWLKRFRKLIAPHKIRYFCVGEYGGRLRRPHYHLLLFNYPSDCRDLYADLSRTWLYGHFDVGTVTQASIHYCTKDIIGKLQKDKYTEPPFVLMSRRPGIGACYTQESDLIKYHYDGLIGYCTLPGGQKIRMPRYYRTKIFDDATNDLIVAKYDDLLADYEADMAKQIDHYYAQYGIYYPDMQSKDYKFKLKKLLKDVTNNKITGNSGNTADC